MVACRKNIISISAGQSNGGTQTPLDEATSPTYDAYIGTGGAGAISQVRLARHWGASEEDTAWQPFATQSPTINTLFGPEVGYARDLNAVIQPEGYNLWIIQYVIGGTNLHTDWDPAASSGDQLYAALKTYYTTMKALITANMPGTVEFGDFIWTQGEADGANEANADAYAANLQALHDQIRLDYGGAFLFNRLGTAQTDVTFLANMKTSQNTFNALGRADAYMVDTDAYATVAGDNTHFDSDSLIILGQTHQNNSTTHSGIGA